MVMRTRIRTILCIGISCLLLLAAAPAYPSSNDENVDPVIPVAVENSIENSPIDSAQIIIELNDYTISDLKKSGERADLKDDQNDLINDLDLEKSDTKKFSRLPAVATVVDSDQLEELKTDDRVKSVYLQERYSVSELEVNQTVMPMLDQATTILGAQSAWNNSPSFTGAGETIVIADSGVDSDHPFLNGKVVTQLCYATGPATLPNGQGSCPGNTPSATGAGSAEPCTAVPSECYHGTHVAGIAAGKRGVGGSAPIGGIAPDADIVAIQIFGVYTGTNPYTGNAYCSGGVSSTCILAENVDILSAMQWTIAHAADYDDVAAINFSLGGGSSSSACDVAFATMYNAVASLKTAGIATVIASGNSGYTSSVAFPACLSNAIAVGSTDKSNNVANYSNTSSQVAVFATGSSIKSSYPGGSYATASGTSMAAPAVAGAFAVMKQAKPSETISQLLTRMQSTGTSVTDSKAPTITRKVPNILNAINYVASPPTSTSSTTTTTTQPPAQPSSVGSVSITAGYGTAYVSWPAVSGATSYQVINTYGTQVANVGSSTTALNLATSPYVSNRFGVRATNGIGSSGYTFSAYVTGIPSSSQVGYTFFAPNGASAGFGTAANSSAGSQGINNMVGGSSNRYSNGAWGVTSAGGVYTYGAAGFFGSMAGQRLNQPMISIASTASSNGYWMVASDGGIFSFGDAQFFGSTGSIKLNKPVVGMAPTPSGNGYWMVASDGGIFSFGDAQFYGSTGSIRLNKPITGMTPTPTGRGYWLVASDGGIFAFGDAQFYGSLGGQSLSQPVIGMKRNDAGSGYWIFTADGGVYTFGSAPYLGAATGRGTNYVQAG